nr:MAG TPA: hypothetical protein [Caudoviricetes sp.]
MHISYVYYLYNFTILTVNIQLSMSTFFDVFIVYFFQTTFQINNYYFLLIYYTAGGAI